MNTEHLKESVMETIARRHVQMRPRWQFILHSVFAVVGSCLIFLTVVYVVSLAVFITQASGAWYAPNFGGRGWFSLLHELPWVLVALVAIFAVLLYVLVRRYRFVYQKPLAYSLAGILCIAFLGGMVISRTPFHRSFHFLAHQGHLPPPVNALYGGPMHPPGGDVYRGRIASTSVGGFLLINEDGESTTSIILTPQTRLPYGADFSDDDLIVVIGDEVSTGTVRAYGVMEIDE